MSTKETKNYEIEKLEKDCIKVTFDVSTEDWKNAIQNSYKKNVRKYKVDGFRQGHAPKQMIEKLYGAGVFFDDAIDEVASKYYSDMLDAEKDLEVVDSPKNFDVIAITDTTFKFKVEVQLKPTITLGKYTGLEFETVKVDATKEEVEAEVKKAIEQAGAWETISDRPCQKDDKVDINYVGKVDGVEFEGGKADHYSLLLGSNTFIPGFEDQVIGMTSGETKDITVTFPSDYGAENLAGKDAIFTVTVNEITVKELPKYDDEFVKDVSTFETVKDYEEDIKNAIIARKQKDADNKLETAIVAKVAEDSKVEIPDCMIERQANSMVDEFEYGLMYRNLNKDDYYKYTNSSREQLVEQYKGTAKLNVLYGLVLEAIKNEVKVPVSDEDVQEAVEALAKRQGMSVDDFKKNLNDQYLDYIRNDVATTKIFEYLKNNNTIKVVDAIEEKKPAKKTTKKAAAKEGTEEKPAKKTTAKKTTTKAKKDAE